MWQWLRILRASFVEVGEIYAYAPLSRFLFHHEEIEKLGELFYFLDKPGLQELFYLLFDIISFLFYFFVLPLCYDFQ